MKFVKLKTCPSCKEDKKVADFRKKGLRGYTINCRKCVSGKLYGSKRSLWLRDLYLKGKCYCNSCKSIKTINKFSKRGKRKDNTPIYNSSCNKCNCKRFSNKRNENLEHYRKLEREYYKNNKEAHVKRQNKYLKSIPKSILTARGTINCKKYRDLNKEYFRKYNKLRSRENRKQLIDSYIKILLFRGKSGGIPISEMKELIKLKRIQLKLKQQLKQQT